MDQLLYKSLSMVYMQIFTVEEFNPDRLHFKHIPDSITRQIFNSDGIYDNPVKRFKVDDFKFEIVIDRKEDPSLSYMSDSIVISGKMFVEMSVYLDRAISLTYRMLMNEPKSEYDDENRERNIVSREVVLSRTKYQEKKKRLEDKKREEDKRREGNDLDIELVDFETCLRDISEQFNDPTQAQEVKQEYIFKKSEEVDINTDDLIMLAALRFGAEHWNCYESKKSRESEAGNNTNNSDQGECCQKTQTNINLEVSDFTVRGFHLTEDGFYGANETITKDKGFKEIQKRYKKLVINSVKVINGKMLNKRSKRSDKREEKESDKFIPDLNYVFVDIWENISHSENYFDERSLSEPEIISHIFEEHKEELVGLMSLYPYEWPYRTKESFEDVCGYNIAIDTDDLILVNSNLCVVFGTYGKRGEDDETDWGEHLKGREEFHVSWPEYLQILEMVLVRKYTLSSLSDSYLYKTMNVTNLRKSRKLIEINSQEGIRIVRILMKLDAIKYSKYVSHKIMFERTMRRLEAEKEAIRLDDTTSKIDRYLSTINENRKMRQSNMLNVVLGIVTAASLLGILFKDINIELIEALHLEEYIKRPDLFVIEVIFLIIVFCILIYILFLIRNNRFRKIKL